MKLGVTAAALIVDKVGFNSGWSVECISIGLFVHDTVACHLLEN